MHRRIIALLLSRNSWPHYRPRIISRVGIQLLRQFWPLSRLADQLRVFTDVDLEIRYELESRHSTGVSKNVRFWPKAAPNFVQFLMVCTSAFHPKPDIKLELVKRSANDPKRPLGLNLFCGIPASVWGMGCQLCDKVARVFPKCFVFSVAVR